MNEPYQWYVLYVRTNAEKRVVDDLSKFVAEQAFEFGVDPFCPESESFYRNKSDRKQGQTYRRRPLFPGYVFIESELPPAEFIKTFGDYIARNSDIVRLLRMSGARDSIAMPRDERQRLEYLLTGKRCVEHSVGYIVGDKVCVRSGALVGREGLIKRINRHNRAAEIEIEMFGGTVKATVALEIVQKL